MSRVKRALLEDISRSLVNACFLEDFNVVLTKELLQVKLLIVDWLEVILSGWCFFFRQEIGYLLEKLLLVNLYLVWDIEEATDSLRSVLGGLGAFAIPCAYQSGDS